MSFIKFLMEQRVEGMDVINPLPGTTDVTVPGIGPMNRDSAERRAVSKLVDIANRAQQPDADWVVIGKLINDSGLHAYISALMQDQA
jgi:hypothetical protein